MSMIHDYPDVPEKDYELRCVICGRGIEDNEMYGVDYQGKIVCQICARERLENLNEYEVFRALGYNVAISGPGFRRR